MRIQLQRRGGGSLGCRNVSRPQLIMPPTPVCLPSCRKYAHGFFRDWLNRDLIGERGGLNLYGFARSSPMNRVDFLGMKCVEAIGRKGLPRYVFTVSAYSGGGWKIEEVKLQLRLGSGPAQAIQQVQVVWEADVTVLCKCKNCFKSKRGTRIYDPKHDANLLIDDPTAMPTGVPVVRSLMQAIGKLAAKGLQIVLKKQLSVMSAADYRTLQALVLSDQPNSPQDGRWKDGKSPCK